MTTERRIDLLAIVTALAAALAALLILVRSPRVRYAAASGAMLFLLGSFGLGCRLAQLLAASVFGHRPNLLVNLNRLNRRSLVRLP